MKRNCIVDCIHTDFLNSTPTELALCIVNNNDDDDKGGRAATAAAAVAPVAVAAGDELHYHVWIFTSQVTEKNTISAGSPFRVNNGTTYCCASLFRQVTSYICDSFHVIGSCNQRLLEILLPNISERHRRGVNISQIEISALNRNNWALSVLATRFCPRHFDIKHRMCALYRSCKFANFIHIMFNGKSHLAQDVYSSHTDRDPFISIDLKPFTLFKSTVDRNTISTSDSCDQGVGLKGRSSSSSSSSSTGDSGNSGGGDSEKK